jgi:hypothetical protein|tara:strand:+ start:4979 stop:5167 length:189 start_codon:yes stop_codon:yes gene_type:complete
MNGSGANQVITPPDSIDCGITAGISISIDSLNHFETLLLLAGEVIVVILSADTDATLIVKPV